jgi:hypothetical protein
MASTDVGGYEVGATRNEKERSKPTTLTTPTALTTL